MAFCDVPPALRFGDPRDGRGDVSILPCCGPQDGKGEVAISDFVPVPSVGDPRDVVRTKKKPTLHQKAAILSKCTPPPRLKGTKKKTRKLYQKSHKAFLAQFGGLYGFFCTFFGFWGTFPEFFWYISVQFGEFYGAIRGVLWYNYKGFKYTFGGFQFAFVMFLPGLF